MKPSKMKRHQETKHPETIGKDKEFLERKKEMALSKRSTDIRKVFERAGSDLQKATKVSFECSLLIAKAKKPHNCGEELIKPACIKIVEGLCGPQAAGKVKSVPLSNNTVKDRIDKMAENCKKQLHEKLREVQFAIQLDETTTVAGESVLIVYVQYVDGDELKRDILMSTNLPTTTTGQDIFMAVDSYLTSYNLPYTNIVACCTDGAAAMMGRNKGFNSRLMEKAPDCVIFHCMIHRQALASKKLSRDLGDTLATVVKVVNFIKARPTNQRLFAQLCEDEAHQTLLLHTEVRWLSGGKVLVRFLELQDKILEFLLNQNTLLEQLTDGFWIKTAYLADIFTLYNETNKRLQGSESNILECKEAIDAFMRKLEYRAGKMSQGHLQHCPLLLQHSGGTVSASEELKSRFADVDALSKESWVMDTFTSRLEDVEYLGCEDELTELQTDSLSKKYFQENGLDHSFSTTYLSETAFSALVAIKTKSRNRLEDHSDFRLAVTGITPDIPSLVKGMQAQGGH
ncbi:hypothetical protein PO909_014582 [Leuciscus waleckii]